MPLKNEGFQPGQRVRQTQVTGLVLGTVIRVGRHRVTGEAVILVRRDTGEEVTVPPEWLAVVHDEKGNMV